MSILLFAFASALCGYLFLVSKQRRRRGLPPLPIIGALFDAILDADDQQQQTTGPATTDNVSTQEVPRPVAVLKNDVGDFMAYPDESSSSSSTATAVQPHPVIAAVEQQQQQPAPQSVMIQQPHEQSDNKQLPGAGMTSTYLMGKQVPESPVSPLSTTSPSFAAPVNEQKDISVTASAPLGDDTPSIDPDSKDSKDSQDPQKKKKKNKKKKKSKSKNKDSKDKKRWSKHKHHDKKKKEATVVDPNNNIPPI